MSNIRYSSNYPPNDHPNDHPNDLPNYNSLNYNSKNNNPELNLNLIFSKLSKENPRLKAENVRLKEENVRLKEKNARLKAEENIRLKENARLKEEIKIISLDLNKINLSKLNSQETHTLTSTSKKIFEKIIYNNDTRTNSKKYYLHDIKVGGDNYVIFEIKGFFYKGNFTLSGIMGRFPKYLVNETNIIFGIIDRDYNLFVPNEITFYNPKSDNSRSLKSLIQYFNIRR